MGAAPSIITVPSTAVNKDVECLRALCPSRFKLEKATSTPTTTSTSIINESTVILKDKNGPLTLIIAAIPVTAAGRIAANRITFVLQENELRSVVNRCEQLQIITNTKHCGTEHILAELTLPGGGAFALVSPAMVSSDRARLELAKKLAESINKSLPKGITRVSSNRELHAMSATSPLSTAPRTLERRQSFGGGRSSSPFTLPQGRMSPSPGRAPSSPYKSSNSFADGFSEKLTSNKSAQPTPLVVAQYNKQKKSSDHADLPAFPTLKFGVLNLTGKYRTDFMANTRSPVPIETEFFVGHMIFLVRPQDPKDDPFWNERVFSKGNRRLVVQVQGKFKYEPKGVVYAGIEASQELHMGRLSRGLSGMLLKWAEEDNQYLYYSFGDDKEKANVVVPAHTFFDRIVVTPQGRAAPSILEALKEDSESIEYRKQCRKFDNKGPEWTWNITDTYSMSFCTSNIDLPTWMLPDVPQLGDLGIQTLIGNSMLRLVMYENFTPPEKDTRHLQHYIRYAFVVQVKYQGNQLTNPKDIETDAASNASHNNATDQKVPGKTSCNNKNSNELTDTVANNSSATAELDSVLDWVKKSHTFSESTTARKQAKSEQNIEMRSLESEKHKGIPDDDTRMETLCEDRGKEKEQNLSEDEMDIQKSESDKFPREEVDEMEYDFFRLLEESANMSAALDESTPDHRPMLSAAAFDNLASIDALCPAWIEMCAPYGKYKRAYAFNIKDRTVFRTPKSFRDLVSVGKYLTDFSESCVDKISSPRASSAEKTRRLFGKMLENALKGRNVESLIKMMEMYSSQFLRRREASFPKNARKSGKTGGLVARALSDRHWVEEWVDITESAICFSHPETRKTHILIKTHSIVNVRCLEKEEAPVFYNHFFMAVETIGRTIYMMFVTDIERTRCVAAVKKFAPILTRKDVDNKLPFYVPRPPVDLELNNPREEFFQKTSMWACRQRLIMNSRQMSFRTPITMEQQNPLAVMEDVLQKAYDPDIENDDKILLSFLNAVSGLKDININDLREEHRLPFFLNLYHTMVAHVSHILGRPDSQTSLIKNCSCLSYQCSDDIFSIAELEHCIIRAAMAPVAASTPIFNPTPPTMVSPRMLRSIPAVPGTVNPLFLSFPIPASKFCFALTKRDFRINFAINSGSETNPAEIPIYKAETLDEQLDDAAYQRLHASVTIKRRNKSHVCMMPKVISWYTGDFGTTNYSIIKTVEPYLSHSERKALESEEFTNYPITIKYLPFSFECRDLVLRKEPSSPRFKASDASVSTTSPTSSTSSTTTVSSGIPSTHITPSSLPNGTGDDIDSLLDFLMNDNLKI